MMGGNTGMGNRKHGQSGTPGNEAIKQQIERFKNKARQENEKLKKKHGNKQFNNVSELMEDRG